MRGTPLLHCLRARNYSSCARIESVCLLCIRAKLRKKTCIIFNIRRHVSPFLSELTKVFIKPLNLRSHAVFGIDFEIVVRLAFLLPDDECLCILLRYFDNFRPKTLEHIREVAKELRYIERSR